MEWIRRQLNSALYLREGQPYFLLMRPFLAVGGYPADLRTGRARIAMAIRCIAYLLYCVTLVHKLLYTLQQPEDATYMSYVWAALGFMVGCVILQLLSPWHFAYLKKLETFFNDRSFAREHPLAGPTRMRCFRWSNLCIVAPQAITLLFIVQSIASGHHNKRHMRLLINGQPRGSSLFNALYSHVGYVPSVSFFLACSIVNACLLAFLGEMEILANCLGELDETVQRELATTSDPDSKTSRKRFWTLYNEELRRCAARHCQIFEALTELQQLSSLVFLWHHFFSLILLVTSAYVTLHENALHENPILTGYPIPLVLLYFTFCLLVEKVQDMNNYIGYRLYSTKWMLQLRYSAEFRREYRSAMFTILILLGRSQQRIRFTCGSIGEISMVRFTEFINLNYTIVMFFINVN